MKVNQKKIFIILVSALATAGCVPVGKKFAIEFKDPSVFKNLKLDVSSVQVQNNQLIVRGSGLKDIKTIKLVSNGVTENLVVESATSGQLVANGLSAVAIGVGKVFDMVLSDAYGSATVPVTFTLENGSITAAQLSDMGAAPGQILKYDGTKWEPSTLSSSQVYQGVWNANTNTPNLNLTSPVSGEYYIVSVAGTYNTVAYDIGDWIIHNGTGWDKVVSSAANKLSLSGGTLTGNLQLDTLLKFKGAANYVTLKASPTLATDIILTLPKTLGTSGQFLTTDGTGVMSWTTPTDPVIANLDASQIANGSVTSTAFQYLAGATSNIQAQLNAKQATGNFVTALTGDVTASGAGSVAATVATVGGATAANIAAGVALANAATDANTPSAIIKRDASGNFSAGTITGTFNGNATNVTGTVAVANGGTGNTTLGLNQLLFGNGASAVSGLPTTAIPAVLLSTVATGAPTWTTSTTGNVLKGSVSGVAFGALTSSDLPAGTLSGSGTANYIPYYNTTSTLANSPIAVSGNNVGIGTTVAGDLLTLGSNGVNAISIKNGTNFGIARLWVDNANDNFNIQKLIGAGNLQITSSTHVLLQPTTGNVGIGTSTPQAKLEIQNVGSTHTTGVLTTKGDLHIQNTNVSAANQGSIITFGSQYNGPPVINDIVAAIKGANDTWANSGAGNLQFFTAAAGAANQMSERMRIDSTGKVGIGTSSPTTALQVVGDISNNGNVLITNNGLINMSQNAYGDKWYFAGSGMKMSMDSGSTSWQTSIGGSTTLTKYRWSTTKAGSINGPILDLGLDGNALFYGNVGIGTTTPNSALQVNGTITGKASVLNATTTIDFSTGNQQYTASSCDTFNLNNLKDGGSYAFAIQGSAAALCSFNAFSDAGVTALTVHMPTNHGLTTASTHTLYNYMVMGTHVYVSWVPGY